MVARVFWPNHLNNSFKNTSKAFLVGWNLRGLVCCVATIVFEDQCQVPLHHFSVIAAPAKADIVVCFVYVQLNTLEDHLKKLREDEKNKSLWNQCSGPPTVIGQFIPANFNRRSTTVTISSITVHHRSVAD